MEIKFLRQQHLSADIYAFYFQRPAGLSFAAGDYLELALDYKPRGGRHWFSIASSPRQNELAIIARVPKNPSKFKSAMANLSQNDTAQVSPPMGTFNLPAKANHELIFVAAGVGITPFLSMFQFIQETKAEYKINLLYAVKKPEDIIYKNLIEKTPNLKTHYVLVEANQNWKGLVHDLNYSLIKKLFAKLNEKYIYLSGAQNVIEKLYYDLLGNNIPKENLMLDYFEGYSDL